MCTLHTSKAAMASIFQSPSATPKEAILYASLQENQNSQYYYIL